MENPSQSNEDHPIHQQDNGNTTDEYAAIFLRDENDNDAEEDDPGLIDDAQAWKLGSMTMYIAPVLFFFTLQSMILQSMMPSVAANWFADCTPSDEVVYNKCKPNYATAQAVSGAVDSVSNLFSFFSAALLGRLSDVYGRRPLLVLTIMVSMLPSLALVLTAGASPIAYYASIILSGILGTSTSGFSAIAIFHSFIADTYTARVRSTHMGVFTAMSALGLVCNPLLGKITKGFDISQAAFLAICICAALVGYIITFVKESLPKSRRNKFAFRRTLNPCAPMRLLTQSSIMRWTSFIYLLMMLPTAGVREIALSYFDEVLNLDGDEAREFSTIFFAMFGGVMFFSMVFVLPIFEYFQVHGTTILLVSQIFNFIHMMLYVSLYLFPYKFIVYLNVAPLIMSSLGNVAATVIVSSAMGMKEQGFALGTLGAVGGLASVVGPFCFSELFAYFSRSPMNFPQAPYVVGALSSCIAVFFCAFSPLRSLEVHSKRLIFSSHSRLYDDMPDLDQEVLPDDSAAPLLPASSSA